MAKHTVVQFERELRKIFKQRTFWLLKAIDKENAGRPPKINRAKVSKFIKKLQDLASQNLSTGQAKKEFNKIIDHKKQWHVKSKGWGWRKKKKSFNRWFEKNIPFTNCIYIFWADSKCIYVGRTIKGKGRPQNHFDKAWFTPVTRLDIFSTSSSSQVPKLECLAIHRFHPKENGIKASIPKWAKKCPIHEAQKDIRKELRQIFSLR